jgi:putative oxidoreductase
MAQANDKTAGAALLILRFFLAVFLLQWSVEKLVVPSATIRIAQSFYGVSLPTKATYALGVAELVLALALLLGAFRTVSYGLSLIVHTITVVVSWRQLLDPYGFAQIGNHLRISTWPTWGAFAALFLLRSWDTYSIDSWRGSRT